MSQKPSVAVRSDGERIPSALLVSAPVAPNRCTRVQTFTTCRASLGFCVSSLSAGSSDTAALATRARDHQSKPKSADSVPDQLAAVASAVVSFSWPHRRDNRFDFVKAGRRQDVPSVRRMFKPFSGQLLDCVAGFCISSLSWFRGHSFPPSKKKLDAVPHCRGGSQDESALAALLCSA